MGAPKDNAPEGAPAPPTPSRRRRPRRSALILGAAAFISATTIAAALLIAVQPAVKSLEYGRLPASCAMVSRATLARYLPNPTGTPEVLPSVGTGKQEYCKWSSTADGEDRTVVSDVTVFSSPGANSEARQFYTSTLPVLACHCPGTAVSTRSVPGLGDQATALFVTAGPDAADISTSGGPAPGLILLVDSRNAYMSLSYSVTATATGAALPADATKLTWMIATARGILADLARPTAVTAAPMSAEPSYAGSRDPCRLITSATLAKYAPGAAVTPDTTTSTSEAPTGARTSTCTWISGNFYILLNLDVFPDAMSAEQGFNEEARGFSQGGAGVTVTATRWLTDLGEQAAAIDETRAREHGVEMLVWSGNVELDYWYSDTASSPPDRATLLAGGMAMARDGLAALASSSASSYPPGPVYANPHGACPLVKTSTLARYAPGATVDQTQIPNDVGPQWSACTWTAPVGSLILQITVDGDADGALAGYQIDLQLAHQNYAGTSFDGAQSVKGLGNQATAIFATTQSGYPEVDLYVLSGNAGIEMSISDLPFGPTLSRAGKLAADTAMARDVLADLPVTR